MKKRGHEKNIAVLASGTGTNFLKIQEYLKSISLEHTIKYLVSNREDASCLSKAEALGIPTAIIQRRHFESYSDYASGMLQLLRNASIQMIVLAGYMVKLPSAVVNEFEGNILNIHPALLPLSEERAFSATMFMKPFLEAA